MKLEDTIMPMPGLEPPLQALLDRRSVHVAAALLRCVQLLGLGAPVAAAHHPYLVLRRPQQLRHGQLQRCLSGGAVTVVFLHIEFRV